MGANNFINYCGENSVRLGFEVMIPFGRYNNVPVICTHKHNMLDKFILLGNHHHTFPCILYSFFISQLLFFISFHAPKFLLNFLCTSILSLNSVIIIIITSYLIFIFILNWKSHRAFTELHHTLSDEYYYM